MNDSQPTDAELAAAVQTLAKLKPGFLPLDIFHQLARLCVMSVIEIVPLRLRDGKVEILLIPRPNNDAFWPGQVHTPGTILRPTDTLGSCESAFQRIFDDELAGTRIKGQPCFVEIRFEADARSKVNSRIYFAEVIGEPMIGAFYDIDHLPANFVTHQIGFIRTAAQAFLASRSHADEAYNKTPEVSGVL